MYACIDIDVHSVFMCKCKGKISLHKSFKFRGGVLRDQGCLCIFTSSVRSLKSLDFSGVEIFIKNF